MLYSLCITVSLSVGPAKAPSSVRITGSTVTWSPSSPGLSHNVTVYYVDTSSTMETHCMNCSSTNITGIVENVDNITVCSYNVVNGMSCMDEACRTFNMKGM